MTIASKLPAICLPRGASRLILAGFRLVWEQVSEYRCRPGDASGPQGTAPSTPSARARAEESPREAARARGGTEAACHPPAVVFGARHHPYRRRGRCLEPVANLVMLTAQQVIDLLGLGPLPLEGGYFREPYRSAHRLPAAVLPPEYGRDKDAGTAIYYLLTPDTCSAMHRLPTDELFHFYLGDPVQQLQLLPDG